MEFIKQTDKRLLPIIRQIGCFFRSAQAIAEMISGKALTPEQINDMWEWAKGVGYIDNKNFMRASAPITNHTLKLLGCKKKVYEVGTLRNGREEYYPSVVKNMARADYRIQKIKTKYQAGTHFRVVNEYERVIYDPDPSIESLGSFYSILYCVVDL